MADDLIDDDEAVALLGVDRERLDAMVAEGMLSATESGDGRRFSRAEVVALRELGG
jgi:excisionase family DNA binding protein